MKISVIIPCYNEEQTILKVIKLVHESLNRYEYEIILVDDGSTDNSMDVIKRFEEIENVYVVVQKNKGLNVSNNIAIRMSRGEFIMRLDADDYLDVRCLEIMISEMERQSNLALVFPDYFKIDENGEILNQVRRHDFKNDVTLLDQPAHGACTMIRKRILEEVGGYDESFNKQDGYDLWLKIIDRYKVSNINLPLFYYRKHGTSLSSDDGELLKTRAEIKKKRVQEKNVEPISVLAVIPTRGSRMDPRSLPMRKLGGKHLIDSTIESAFSSELLSNILVTTPDSNVIHHIRNKYGDRITIVDRSEELARINMGFQSTIVDSVIKFEDNHPSPDAVMVLNIESPFKSTLYIEKAIHTLQLFEVSCVKSVIIDDGFFYEHDGSGLRSRVSNGLLRLERDSLYREAGGITLYDRSVINDDKLPERNIGHVVVDHKSSFRIESDLDWKIAESIMDENCKVL